MNLVHETMQPSLPPSELIKFPPTSMYKEGGVGGERQNGYKKKKMLEERTIPWVLIIYSLRNEFLGPESYLLNALWDVRQFYCLEKCSSSVGW